MGATLATDILERLEYLEAEVARGLDLLDELRQAGELACTSFEERGYEDFPSVEHLRAKLVEASRRLEELCDL